MEFCTLCECINPQNPLKLQLQAVVSLPKDVSAGNLMPFCLPEEQQAPLTIEPSLYPRTLTLI